MIEFTLVNDPFSDSIDLGGAIAHPTTIADLDRDGLIEIVPTLFTFPGGVPLPLRIFEIQEDGSTIVDIAPELFGGDMPNMDFGRKAIVTDLNNDNFDDLVIADHGFDQNPFPGASNIGSISDGKGSLRNIGDRFETEPQFTHSAAVGDFDGDGRQDIFWGNLGVDDAFISSISGSGAVQRIGVSIPSGVNQFTWSHAADLNSDGKDELILGANQDGDTTIRNLIFSFDDGQVVQTALPRFNNLALTFDAAEGAIVTDIETTDLNGDGLLDILLFATGVVPFYQGFAIQALEQTATGGFVDRSVKYFDGPDFDKALIDGAGLEIQLADLDVDGDVDLLFIVFFPTT